MYGGTQFKLKMFFNETVAIFKPLRYALIFVIEAKIILLLEEAIFETFL